MLSSSWRSNDPKAAPIHFQRHQETISINCPCITIDPTLIRHSLSRSIQPVIHKLCQGMSVFGWNRKCQSISRSVWQTQNCFVMKLWASTGMSLLGILTMKKEVHQKAWELVLCLSVWVQSYDAQKQLSIFWNVYLYIYVDWIGCITNQGLHCKTSCLWEHNLIHR